MADYKIANIKWLRDQGWSISSSYASSLCPTYNEIVNEIPKDSNTVNVNETCVATSKAYTNNQLVCESDISISLNCSVYGFVDRNISVDSSSVTQIVAESLSSANTLTFSSSKSANWITFNSVETLEKKMYICDITENTSQDIRRGFAVFTSNDGCEFTATVIQSGKTEQKYEIGYTLTSTINHFSTPIKYINGSASIFTQSELSTVIQIEPYYKSQEPAMCEVLDAKAMTLEHLLKLVVGDKLYEDDNVYGKNLCIAGSIAIIIQDDPTGIWKRIVLTKTD